MKVSVFFLTFSLFTGSALANPIHLTCEFLPESGLEGFQMTLDEDSAHIQFEGKTNLQRLNPAGETVTLNRRRPFTANWMLYEGVNVLAKKSATNCTYTVAGKCASPARAYDLSFSQVSLARPGERSGSLSFTPRSEYYPAEAFYSHSIYCEEVN